MIQEDADYYSKHLPQSEYRITKSTGRRSPAYMKLELEKLPRIKRVDKQVLRERIEDQMNHLMDTLVGDIEIDGEWKDQVVHHIYAQLGI